MRKRILAVFVAVFSLFSMIHADDFGYGLPAEVIMAQASNIHGAASTLAMSTAKSVFVLPLSPNRPPWGCCYSAVCCFAGENSHS